MKHRRQSEHDPNYLVRKHDKWGNINPRWKAVYEKKGRVRTNKNQKPKR